MAGEARSFAVREEGVAPQVTGHTPGPWRLDDRTTPGAADILSETYHCIDAGVGYFARDDKPGFSLTGFMTIEDARLIAAAPDLLKALTQLRDELQVWNSGGDDRSASWPESRIKRANAAIAKAVDK